MADPVFHGFVRSNGEVGVRNYLLVLSITGLTGPAARQVARASPGSRLVTMPYGGGLMGEDRALHLRALAGFGRNPSVGGVLLISSDPPKGEAVAAEISAAGKPVASVCLDDCGHDILTLSDRAIRAGCIGKSNGIFSCPPGRTHPHWVVHRGVLWGGVGLAGRTLRSRSTAA